MSGLARFMEGASGTFVVIILGWAIVVFPGYFVFGLTDDDGLGYMSLVGIAVAGWLYVHWLRQRFSRADD